MKSQIEVKHYKVLTLPISADPNSIYYVLDSISGKVKTYITDKNGIPIPLIDLTGVGSMQSVTGTGVTGSLINPKIDIDTFVSSQIGNLIELSLEDGKLVVKSITSPNSSISVVETTSELQIQLSAAITAQIDSALQPGANMSDLTNDVGYIMTIDVTELAQDAVGAILLDTTTIDLTYTDLIPSITASVKPNSITSAELSNTINISEFINDSSFETTTQLNVRDTNNRSRASHTGTQLASTISDFTSSARTSAVDNFITDGIIDKAPSENAVFDALALKEDKVNKQNTLTADGTGIKYVTVDGVRTHTTDLNNPHAVTKTQVGLSNVDNTSDINKPVSSAQQITIDAKVADVITNGVTTIAPSQNSVFDSLSVKAYLPTGLLKNGALSINAVNTTYNLSAGTGIITNFDNPDAPTSRIVTFPAVIGKTPTYLTTGLITYVGIQEIGTTGVGQIIEQATPFTDNQNHDLIPIGAVIHSNLTFINYVNNITNPSNDIGGQFHAFLDKLGAFNVTGNKFTANGANLGLNKSAGSLYKRGSNFINNWKNANEIAQPATTYLTFRYRTQIDAEGADRINLDPSLYDVGGVLTAVPVNKYTIQTVNLFQEGAVRVQWGQTIYNSLAEAEAALPTRVFVKESNIALQAVPRAYIILKNTTTSLLTAADAKIIEAGKFDGFVSGGAALTLSSIISALGYTPENVANKVSTVTASATNYPNNDAVIAYVSANVTTTPDATTTLKGKVQLAGDLSGTADLPTIKSSVALTGAPTAPTATAGTNTTQIANAAFVTGAINIADSGNVKLTGNQSIAGVKTFSNKINVFTGGSGIPAIDITNGSPSANGILIDFSNPTNGYFLNFANSAISKFRVSDLGVTTATSFIKNSATTTNLLLAGGTDITQASLPISTATQTALDLKAPLASPTFTGVLNGASGVFSSSVTANGNSVINGTAGGDTFTLNKATGASLAISGATGTTNPILFSGSNSTNPDLLIVVGGAVRQTIASATGAATFSSSVTANGGTFGEALSFPQRINGNASFEDIITYGFTGQKSRIQGFNNYAANTSAGLRFITHNANNVDVNALTLETSGAATFASSVTAASYISGTNGSFHFIGTSGVNDTFIIRNNSYGGGNNIGTTSLRLGYSDHLGVKIEGFKQDVNRSGFKFYTEDGYSVPKLALTISNYDNATFVGSVSATNYITTSDETLKDIISRDGDVIRYTWKNKQDDLIHIGYSAQEKRIEYPDAVHEDEEGLLSVSYVEILVDKIRKLEKRIEQLEKNKLN